MKTLKTFITFLVALCAIFCVFTGCKTAEVETTTQNLENTVEVPVEAPVEDESVVEPTKDFLGRDNEGGIVLFIPVTQEKLTGGWTLYTMQDKDGEYPISCEVSMSFNFGEESEIYGCAGINNYHGTIQIEGFGDISFGPIAVTKMAGLPEDMETEDNFLRILSDVNQIAFVDNSEGIEELALYNVITGSSLCFIR